MESKQSVIHASAGDRLLSVFAGLIMLIALFCILYPFWSLFADSISSSDSALSLGLTLWPSHFSLEAYREVLTKPILGIAYLNTIGITSVGSVLTTLVCFLAAYALSKRRMPFVKILTMMVLITMFFNGGLIPTYLLMQHLHLVNNRWVLILPHLANGFYIFIMRNFIYSIPEELEESAYLDGANELQIALRIYLPLSKPILATVLLWTAVYHWNEWFEAMIYLRDTNMTVLQMLLRRILVENQLTDMLNESSLIQTIPAQSVKAATMFIAIGPIIAMYPFVQKYFIQGLMVGALKG